MMVTIIERIMSRVTENAILNMISCLNNVC